MIKTDKQLIIESIKRIEKERFTTTDITNVILTNYKDDLKKARKNTDIRSVRPRVSRTLRSNNLKDFNLKIVDKAPNGAKIYSKLDYEEDLDLDALFELDEEQNEDSLFGLDEGNEEQDDIAIDLVNSEHSYMLRELIKYTRFILNLKSNHVAMACNSSIAYCLLALLERYLNTLEDNIFTECNIDGIRKDIYSLVPQEEILMQLKISKENLKYMNDLYIPDGNAKLEIENELLDILKTQ